ncbi:T9SS-dependent choice-of-anchor J family protein [Hymenobacter lucidus]|uniref:Choice-of-anchor J domain-containing protein n=1 Tax=Hymenobacter lucidus TaxID=2880930 RepID=A0ABS8AUP0_9BACT|nr:T9SS type A sorting domain-containing protein [Hymenobacter lucidus]MCB2409928.1 choice-of-anchor J domain-containing protein [Hymenobacter lucidus]
MTNWYKTGRSTQRWRQLALAALLATGATAAQAQVLNYNAFGTQNTATTYTDLGTTGTVITTANTDDANSAAQPIGFTFNYNGTAFTEFVLNTNGFLKLGNQAPSAANLYYTTPNGATGDPISSTNAADVNILLPFNVDLVDGTSPAEYRVATTGTAPNRVCTIQWKNVSDKLSTATLGKQYANMEFQVKLYEANSMIDFVYGNAVAGPGPNALKTSAIGIKGSGSTATQTITVTKASSTAWAQATFLAGNYTVNAHNFRLTVLPDAGRTYRFQKIAANDAAVVAVYSLGKLPLTSAVPHTIQAVVRNVGTSPMTNVSVTATVAGVNTYTSTKTIASLAVDAQTTVSFDPFTPTVVGNETITVTAAADDITSNGTKTYLQQVTTNTYAVAEPGVAVSGSIGFGVNASILAVKYNTTVARQVSAVTVRLADPASVGQVVYAVVTNSAGVIVGRTPNYTVVAADINTDKVFTLATPASVPAGDFYAGLAQTASTVAHYPIGTQNEKPTRLSTFYSIALNGGAPGDQGSADLGRMMIEATTSAPVICVPQTVTAFPYSENFDAVSTGTLPCGITVEDVNADQVGWQNRSTVPADPTDIVVASSAPNAMTYYYNENSITTPANDWFYTPALFLRAGTSYQLSFKYRTSGNPAYPERLEVKYGPAASATSQTTALWTNANIVANSYQTANATSTIPVLAIQPATTGNYYIGFHAYSLANQFFLSVDDLQVVATAITSTSSALERAISVFPNPSTGIVTVDIQGAKAKGAMQVEVLNSLGQTVHTASVRDNELNKLDLSNLSAGMYVLKVKSGNEFTVRNLSIQK